MKIKQTVLVFALLIGLGGIFVSPVAMAAKCGSATLKAGESCCGGVVTSIISCDEGDSTTDIKDTGIWGILMLVINILTAGVAVAAVAGIVWGSILFTTATGSPEQFKKARMVILNTVIGIVLYGAMFSFLNFLIPGGIFN